MSKQFLSFSSQQESLANNGNKKAGEDKTWKWKNSLFQEESSSPPHQEHHSLDLDPLFTNTKDFDNPEFWMNGEGDAWLDQMNNLVGILEMDFAALRIPMQRITRRGSGKSLLVRQTKRDSTGRKMDGRIRILKKLEPGRNPGPLNHIRRLLSHGLKRSESSKIPFNTVDAVQKRSNPIRLTRLLNIQKALRILGKSIKPSQY